MVCGFMSYSLTKVLFCIYIHQPTDYAVPVLREVESKRDYYMYNMIHNDTYLVYEVLLHPLCKALPCDRCLGLK